ncbi:MULTISPECIES: DUF6152 family protein [Catenuloplanes]|uniref:Uncharacterized protein n=1 Tax=Catenuloplanes niger TaxID=587534 RepID=A0AAE4CX63_9ACTN|nr:DUF6152 family protein [Catenuloplanes niger]MDR7327147.1 hypothetical protein [Catenuloplanes niger]
MRLARRTVSHDRSRTGLGKPVSAFLAVALTLIVVPAEPARAHHGFDDFDTDRLYYLAGTVSDVRWGDPHSYFRLTLDRDRPADTPDLALPEQLQAPEDSGPINAAPSYGGSHDELEVVIAPPSYTGRWGLDRPLADGERVEAVGYVGRSHDDEFRPVVFWFENGTPVNQVLGSQLPARPLPVPYPDDDNRERDTAAAARAPDRPSALAVWGTAGGVLVAGVLGAALYLRARSRRSGGSAS